MYFYSTSGTPEFMETIQAKHSDLNMLLLFGQGNSLLMYETDKKKSVFATPRKFEVIDGRGEFEHRGFIGIENIPVVDESRPVFEQAVKKSVASLHQDSSCIAFRVLRPIKAETYLIITQWAGPASYDVWKQSSAYKNDLASIINKMSTSTQAMYNSKAYTSTFSVAVKE